MNKKEERCEKLLQVIKRIVMFFCNHEKLDKKNIKISVRKKHDGINKTCIPETNL